jgi:hypothetical protein
MEGTGTDNYPSRRQFSKKILKKRGSVQAQQFLTKEIKKTSQRNGLGSQYDIPKTKRRFPEKGTERRPNSKKRKESAIIAVKKDISPESIDCLRLIIRRPTIPKRNEDEEFKKSLSRKDLEKPRAGGNRIRLFSRW